MSYSLTYGLSFAAVTSIIVHTYLYNGREIWAKVKNSRHGGEDIHKRLMHAYKEVPDWWYVVLTVIVLGLGILTVQYWESGLPVWGFLVVCFGLAVLLIVPEGILQGTTNQRVYLNIIVEFIAGYAWPGNAIANTMVKCYGNNAVKHGLDFAQDLKMGQYMVSFISLSFFFFSFCSIYMALIMIENSSPSSLLRANILEHPSNHDADRRYEIPMPCTFYSCACN